MSRLTGFVLVLAACAGGTPGSDTKDSGTAGTSPPITSPPTPTVTSPTPTVTVTTPDTLVGPLSDRADLCAYEQTAPDPPPDVTLGVQPPPPTGYLANPPSPYAACLDGTVSVLARTVDLAATGRLETHEASAQFFSLTEAPHGFTQGTLLAFGGLDGCTVIASGAYGLTYTTDLVFFPAGDVTLLGPFGAYPLYQYGSAYSAQLQYDAIPAGFGEPYGFSIGGTAATSTAPSVAGVELTDVITLPERIELASPALVAGAVIARADTDLVWTGTSDGLVHLALSAFQSGTQPPWYDVDCELVDDGAFTLPGSVLTLLPLGSTGYLTLQRSDAVLYGTTAGRTFRATGSTAHEIRDLILY